MAANLFFLKPNIPIPVSALTPILNSIMKKVFAFIIALCLATGVNAQIDNLANLSPEWTRIGSRNAATDAPDIMMYNPAGMVRLEAGLHIGIGNQSYFRKPSHKYDLGLGPATYQQDGNDLFVPNINIGFTKDRWSVFGGAYIAGGGATANYPSGSVNTDLIVGGFIPAFNALFMADYTAGKDAYLKGNSYYLATSVGGAYALNERISAGVSVRNLTARSTTEAGFTLAGSASGLAPDMPLAVSTKDNASGMGIVAGMHAKINGKFNLSFRYESKVTLEFETTVEKDEPGLFTDGAKFRRDLPSVTAVGISYQATEKLKVMSDMNYYFQKNADWGPVEIEHPDYAGTELAEMAGNAYTLSLGFEYAANESLVLSLGGVYSVNDIADREAYYTHLGAFETIMETNFTLCTGFALSLSEKVRLNMGLFHAFYPDQTVKALYYLPYDVDVKIKNSITSVGIGVNFKI